MSRPLVMQLIQAPQRRGAEIFAWQLSRALQDNGWDSLLVSLYPGDPEFAHAAGLSGAWGSAVPPRRGGLPVPWTTFRGLRALYRSVRPMVLQANGAATLKYLALVKLTGGNTPLVYRSIGMPSFWRRDAARKLLYGGLFRFVDRIVAVCRKAGEELLATGVPATRVVVIPNGVDVWPFLAISPEARRESRAMASASAGDVVLAHVGSFTPEKNHNALIRLLAWARHQGIEAKLWLLGEGQERQRVERLAQELNVRRHVWFGGSRDDVPAVLAGADIFVLPSASEGMPAALIEAGLSRLPAVAYDVGGVGEVVVHERTGLLVPQGDERGLQEAVACLARDHSARCSMGAVAREMCLRFDIRRVAAEYASVYAGLVG